MSLVMVSVHLPDKNGMPKDDTVNTFVIGGIGHPTTDLPAVVTPKLIDFYNTQPATVGGGQLCDFLGGNLDRGANRASIVYYGLDNNVGTINPTLPLGSPFQVDHFQLGGTHTAPTSLDLPRQVAGVLSLQCYTTHPTEDVPGGPPGPKGDTHPAARQRGRLYLGPLNMDAIGAGINGPGLSAGFRNMAGAAAKALQLAMSVALEGLAWFVFSRVAHVVHPILGGFVDDSIDIVRRRKIGASTRTLWSVV